MNKDLSKQYIDAKELIKDTETQKLDIADQLAVMAHNVLIQYCRQTDCADCVLLPYGCPEDNMDKPQDWEEIEIEDIKKSE